MIRTSIRVASAIAGALALFIGVAAIRNDFREGAAMLIESIILFAPLCMPAIDAAGANRFRIAAMICFAFAGLTWIAVMLMRNHDAANSIAALGVAWWVAGFTLTPIAAYYHSRAKMRGLWRT
jgi:uncharacterized membrane protein